MVAELFPKPEDVSNASSGNGAVDVMHNPIDTAEEDPECIQCDHAFALFPGLA